MTATTDLIAAGKAGKNAQRLPLLNSLNRWCGYPCWAMRRYHPPSQPSPSTPGMLKFGNIHLVTRAAKSTLILDRTK